MRVAIASFALLLTGCAGSLVPPSPAPVAVNATFNPAEITWYQERGANIIRGNAVLRTVGGDVRTCAGLPANLIPVSAYAEERFRLMFGKSGQDISGYLPARTGFQFAETDPEYERNTRTTQCDSQGDFTFSGLPDGEYFVTAFVTWGVPQRYFTSQEGGLLMRRVHLAGGETKEIVLTAM